MGKQVPINEALLIPQVASLLALGKSTTEIATQLNLGFNTVKRLSTKDECKAVVKDIADAVIATAKAVGRRHVAEMTELATDALKKALKDGNMMAVNTHFKVIGLLNAEEQTSNTGAQSLTIILPGANTEKPAIEIENTDESN